MGMFCGDEHLLLPQMWYEALRRVGEFELCHGKVYVWGDLRTILVQFPQECKASRAFCDAPGRVARLQKAVSDLTGQAWHVSTLHGSFASPKHGGGQSTPADDSTFGYDYEPSGVAFPGDTQEPDTSAEETAGLNNCFFKTATVIEHDGLQFRSPAEVAIYDELKGRKLLFFPNAAAVLGGAGAKREPDFLVCCGGKWGVLEVMGETYHTSSTAVKDHDRARLFKEHGLLCVEFFPAQRCQADPAKVVDEFLAVLRRH